MLSAQVFFSRENSLSLTSSLHHKLIKLLQTAISLIPIRPIVSYICDMCEFYMEIEQTLNCRATVTSVLQCEQQRLQLRPIDRLFNIVVHPCSQTSVHVLLSSMC